MPYMVSLKTKISQFNIIQRKMGNSLKIEIQKLDILTKQQQQTVLNNSPIEIYIEINELLIIQSERLKKLLNALVDGSLAKLLKEI